MNSKRNLSPAEARTSKSGFTLIELLVVIAIIAILAAILFPVFQRVRENARRASCQSNEKQLGLAFIQYVQDNDEMLPGYGAYPVPAGAANPSANGYKRHGWASAIYPFVKSVGLYHCPDDAYVSSAGTTGDPQATPEQNSQPALISYAITTELWAANTGNGLNISKFSAPASTILLLEAGDPSYGYQLESNLDPSVAGSESGQDDDGNQPFAVSARHDPSSQPNSNSVLLTTSSNYLLNDGHVKYVKRSLVSFDDAAQGYPKANISPDNLSSQGMLLTDKYQ